MLLVTKERGKLSQEMLLLHNEMLPEPKKNQSLIKEENFIKRSRFNKAFASRQLLLF